MAIEKIVPGVYRIPLGIVNAFLLDTPEDCVLIDTGFPGNEKKIESALQELGKQPGDIQHLLLTHTHPDHIGSLAALESGPTTYMHPLDAPIASRGSGFRPLTPAPGALNWLLVQIIGRKNRKMQVGPGRIDVEVNDGDVLPIAGGITAIHSPGHCLGHLAYLWPQQGGVLFIGDACGNTNHGPDWSIGYEDIAEGERSLRKLARFDFQVACFGHGRPIRRNAAKRIRSRWKFA